VGWLGSEGRPSPARDPDLLVETVLGASIRSAGRIERRTTPRNRTAANERRSAEFSGRKGTRRADRAPNAGATQQTCRGQARRQDEGEQGSVRHEVGRRPVVGDAQPRFGRASVAWGHRALLDRAPADHRWDSDRQEPWGKAPDRAGVALLHRRPQAQGPTRVEPDPQGRRRRSRWG